MAPYNKCTCTYVQYTASLHNMERCVRVCTHGHNTSSTGLQTRGTIRVPNGDHSYDWELSINRGSDARLQAKIKGAKSFDLPINGSIAHGSTVRT